MNKLIETSIVMGSVSPYLAASCMDKIMTHESTKASRLIQYMESRLAIGHRPMYDVHHELLNVLVSPFLTNINNDLTRQQLSASADSTSYPQSRKASKGHTLI